jgi:hypothetical protein
MSGWVKLATHFLMNQGELALAALGTALQFCLFLRLITVKGHRQFPIFCAYVGFSVVSTIIASATSSHVKLYFYIYWVSEFFSVVLTFLSLQESFRSVFRNFYSFNWFRMSFPAIGILIVLIALVRAVFFRPANHSPLAVTLLSLEIAVGFLQFGIFCLFIVLVRFFHMHWRQQAFGIILGFGIAAAGTLIAFLLRSEFGTNIDRVFRIATPLSYIIGVAVWLATFLRGPAQLTANWDSNLTPEQMIAELKRHTQTVKGILGR